MKRSRIGWSSCGEALELLRWSVGESSADMTVSLCMIVRDEEKYLGQALESCQPFADEVIVVDTGSHDRTIDIAMAHGAKVTHFEWADDFSLARNFSISQAAGEWILILDADEAISKQDYGAFRKLLSDPTVCWLFATRNYSNDPCLSNYKTVKGDYPEWERSYSGYFEGNRVRLFPNDPQIRFEGRVHELVEHTIHKLGKYRIQKTEIRIHHYGHTPEAKGERDERKAQLYAVTGEAKTREDPTYWQNYFELALEFSSRRLFHQSLQNFEERPSLIQVIPRFLATWGMSYARWVVIRRRFRRSNEGCTSIQRITMPMGTSVWPSLG